jgi:YaaC-like Protein
MSPLPAPRLGERLVVRDRPLDFGFWPLGRTTRRYGLQVPLYCGDPWPLLSETIRTGCPPAQRLAAVAFLDQAKDLYSAAANRPVSAAKPLILYYCYLNLAKAFILTTGQRKVLDKAQHGLSEQLGPGLQELTDAYLDAYPSTSAKINVFHEFLKAVSGSGLGQVASLPVPQLLPQVVPGHRLWVAASGKRERFLGVERVTFMRDAKAKKIWLRLHVYSDNLAIVGLTHAKLLSQTDLAGSWKEVRCSDSSDGRRLVCFEQVAGLPYTSRAPDEVPNLIAAARPRLWATALMYSPWRRYYLYASPVAEQQTVLPQLASVYALTYYFGSIARYRPHHFQRIMDGPYGPWLQTFLNEQPTQFLFLLASDIVRRDLLKAAIA